MRPEGFATGQKGYRHEFRKGGEIQASPHFARWYPGAESIMAYSTRSYARSFSNSGGLPPAIKWLLISNVGIYVLGLVLRLQFLSVFALRPVDVVTHFYLWQLVTYMFLHGSIFHILFNMLTLWWFGADLERTLG